MGKLTAKWVRPPGPPMVWRTIDSKEKLDDKTIADVRLSIQDIPRDRFEDALDHMHQYFLNDEPLNKCLNSITDEDQVKFDKSVWRSVFIYLLNQGISIGAFKLNSSGQLGELIGMCITYVASDESKKKINEIVTNSNSANTIKIFALLDEAYSKFDICEKYGVDKYISELGLSVKPTFRGQKIGVQILEVWSDIARKYGISLCSALFSATASQIQGERAGFETILTMKHAELFDEKGQLLFPNIDCDSLTWAVKQVSLN